MQLVTDGKVLFPMSSAHMAETCQWTHDDGRYELALTILQLSAGWQMRDPLDVRREELRASFSRIYHDDSLERRPVFTLEPNALYGSRIGVPTFETTRDLPAEMQLALEALTATMGTFDTMLDGEYVAAVPVPGWAERQQDFNQLLATTSGDSRQKSKVIDSFFIEDTEPELTEEAARADVTQEDFSDWLRKRSRVEFATMPALGLFREVMREKHLNRGTNWSQNDLTDMVYLTCGAAYADIIVCEGSIGSAMKRSLKRLGRPANVMRSLEELVARLAQLAL